MVLEELQCYFDRKLKKVCAEHLPLEALMMLSLSDLEEVHRQMLYSQEPLFPSWQGTRLSMPNVLYIATCRSELHTFPPQIGLEEDELLRRSKQLYEIFETNTSLVNWLYNSCGFGIHLPSFKREFLPDKSLAEPYLWLGTTFDFWRDVRNDLEIRTPHVFPSNVAATQWIEEFILENEC